jgi:hypothetical protein
MNAGEKVKLAIPQDDLGPVQYAEKLYKKAAKQRRASEQLQPLIDDAEKQLEYIDEVEDEVMQLSRCVYELYI